MIMNIGKIISKIIVGHNKKPGIPKPSIQDTVSLKFTILLYPESKKTEDINTLPTRSKKLDIVN